MGAIVTPSTDPAYYTPMSTVIGTAHWPEDLLEPQDSSFLDSLACIQFDERLTDERASFFLQARVMSEVRFDLPLLEGMSLVLGRGGGNPDAGMVDVYGSISGNDDAPPDVELRIETTVLSIGVDPDILTPVSLEEEDGKTVIVKDDSRDQVTIDVPMGLSVSHTPADGWEIDFEPPGESDTMTIPTCEIGDTGVIIENAEIGLNLAGDGPTPAGPGSDWRGILLESATIRIPEVMDAAITASRLGIGSGGITGEIAVESTDASYDPETKTYSGQFGGTLLGLDGALTGASLTFRQNTPVSGGLTGEVIVPHFEERVAVEISVNADAGFLVTVTDAPDDGQPVGESSDAPGLITLKREDVYEINVDSIGLEIDDEETEVVLTGTIQPLVSEIDLPGIRIDELSIDSEGNVELEGGWIDLKEQYSVLLGGFTFEITKLGFGSEDDGTNWIGLNGSITFTDEITAGASVDGFRIHWDEDGPQGVSFEGIGIEFEVPGAIRFDGEVSYTTTNGAPRFDGDLAIDLISLGVTIDGSIVLGTKDDFTFFAVYLEGQLPSGIPLWSSGLSLYGLSGLFANKMSPGREATPGTDELAWFDAADQPNSWYHKGEDGVTDLEAKWGADEDGMAIGAGVILGTAPDNGYSLNSRLLMVVSFPGPVIMLNGRANMLKKRQSLNEEAMFGALAVLDARAGTFTFGLDAKYLQPGSDLPASGSLTDIRGSAEAFYDFQDPSAWYLNIGQKEPRSARVRADYLSLFSADAYLMLNAQRVALGGRYGYDAHYGFGPLSVDLEAWIEANAVLSFNPVHFTGELWLHGRIAVQAFGFGIGISADARLSADVADPFHIKGELSVSIECPWPLPDPSADVTLEWGPKLDSPPIPQPLGDVSVKHQKSTASWPLPRADDHPEGTGLVVPDYGHDSQDGMLASSDNLPSLPSPSGSVVTPSNEPDPADVPVVPLDGRPQLTFNRPVNDDIDVDGKSVADPGWQQVGDPAADTGPVEVRYSLTGLELLEGVPQSDGSVEWTSFDSTGQGGSLHGSWVPLARQQQSGTDAGHGDETPRATTKLWLYTESPYAYARHSGGEWPEYLDRETLDYPCPPSPTCYDCAGLDEWDLEVRNEVNTEVHEVPGGETTIRTRRYVATREDDPTWPVASVEHEGDAKEPTVEPASVHSGSTPVLRFYGDHHGGPIEGTGDPVSRILPLRLDLPYAFEAVAVTVRTDADTDELVAEATDDGGTTHTETADLRQAGPTERQFVLTAEDGAFDAVTVTARKGLKYREDRENYNPPLVELDLIEVCGSNGPIEGTPAHSEAIDRVRGSVDRWADTGQLLRPNRLYRLRIDTKVEARGTDGFDFERTETLSEFAYFRTGGPPGLGGYSTPIGTESDSFSSGLDDLDRYVRETTPETVGVRSTDPPGPFFRAYDVGVTFNENYVDQLYRSFERDLGLYLFDANGRPVRDSTGRLTVVEDTWGPAEQTVLNRDQRRYREQIERRDCLTETTGKISIASDVALDSGTTSDGELVLNPETTYEARLVPMALNERFTEYPGFVSFWDIWEHEGASANWTRQFHRDFEGTGASVRSTGQESTVAVPGLSRPGEVLDGADVIHFESDSARASGRYTVVDADGSSAPPTVTVRGEPSLGGGSTWSIPARGVVSQRGSTGSDTTRLAYTGEDGLENTDPVHPSNWQDYRVTAICRNGRDRGEVGLAVRGEYGVVLDYEADQCLLRAPDDSTIGSPVDYSLDPDRDYRLVVEVVGDGVTVYIDGDRVLDRRLSSVSPGGVALQCAGTDRARFGEVRVDDFGATIPPAYRFAVTTSAFADVGHQLHSFQDESWHAALPSAAQSALSAGRSPSTTPNDAEVRAYEEALDALTVPEGVDALTVTRIGSDPSRALLVQSPEPIDWENTDLTVERAPTGLDTSIPGDVKLTRASLGNNEHVRLLAREAVDLSDYRVESYRPTVDDEPLIEADELREDWTFPSGTAEDEGWTFDGNALRHRANTVASGTRPGLAGDDGWTDYLLTATVEFEPRSSTRGRDAAGLLVRAGGPGTAYRFTIGTRGAEFVRLTSGSRRVLWRSTQSISPNDDHELAIACLGSRLVGLIDDQPVFDLTDGRIHEGGVGVLSRADARTRVDGLRVQSIERAWAPYHTVGDRERMPAGTEVELRPGVEASREPGLRTWPLDSTANARLPPDEARLRLVSPDGTVVHERSFRPDAAYARESTVNVLRSADGTGAIVTTGGPLTAGQYRLAFTYDLDAADRTRGGQGGTERVVLDVPWQPADGS